MKPPRKAQNLPISVLNLPPKSAFTELPSPHPDYSLCCVEGRKMLLQKYRVLVQKTKLFATLEIYEWRSQTEFPIPKTKFVSIQPSHMQTQNIVELMVYIEHCPLKLNKIHDMNINQSLYMLKEAILGFERLCSRFGPFKVTSNMIGVNERGLCKVWLNDNFSLNFPSAPESTEQAMVASIVEILQKHSHHTVAGIGLWDQLKISKSFLSALKEVDWFIRAENL
jgi:hypothetical protein